MKPASIRNNNPGAMYPGKSSKKFGSTSYETLRSKDGVHKIATFPTAVHGAAAQFDLLHSRYTGQSIEAAIKKWCGGFYALTYLKVLNEKAGVTKDTKLTKELVRNPNLAIPLCRAMAWQEAGREYPMSDADWAAAHSMAFGGQVAPAFQDDNDVPTPKPETRRNEAIKTAAPIVGACGGGVALPFLPSIPTPPVDAVANVAGWQNAAETINNFAHSPVLYLAVGGIILYALICHLFPSWAERKSI